MDANPIRPIYVDYAATPPVDPASRSHACGRVAEAVVEIAREHVAAVIGADPRMVVWTSGATEGNNLATKGGAQFHQARGRHLITLKTEHKAVLDAMRERQRAGWELVCLDEQPDGLLGLDTLAAALQVRRKPRVRIEAQMHGGGHERGMRSGTLPTHQIVGMGEAWRPATRWARWGSATRWRTDPSASRWAASPPPPTWTPGSRPTAAAAPSHPARWSPNA